MSFSKCQGFSFISVIFLILFLSISTVAIFSKMKPSNDVNATRNTIDKMKILEAAIVRYTADVGAKPTTLDALIARTTESACAPDPVTRKLIGWCGPYIDIPIQQNNLDYKTDGWGVLFQLLPIPPGPPTTLKSCGPNLSCGDGDDITDTV